MSEGFDLSRFFREAIPTGLCYNSGGLLPEEKSGQVGKLRTKSLRSFPRNDDIMFLKNKIITN